MRFLILFLFPIALQAQSFMGYAVKNGDVSLYVKVFGDKGNPIVIINGGPGMNSNGFNALADSLAIDHVVYLYDQRGTGRFKLDSCSSENINMELMVEDLEAIRKHFKIDRWIVMGQSFGGMLAYQYAATYPEYVAAMIQSSSGGMDLSIRNSILIQARLTELQRDSLSYYSELRMNGDTSTSTDERYRYFLACAYVYNDEKYAPIIATRLNQANFEINQILWTDMIENEFDYKEEMLSYQGPVLITVGQYDVVDLASARLAHEILPHSTLEIIANSGHYGWLDNPLQYFNAVRTFLYTIEL